MTNDQIKKKFKFDLATEKIKQEFINLRSGKLTSFRFELMDSCISSRLIFLNFLDSYYGENFSWHSHDPYDKYTFAKLVNIVSKEGENHDTINKALTALDNSLILFKGKFESKSLIVNIQQQILVNFEHNNFSNEPIIKTKETLDIIVGEKRAVNQSYFRNLYNDNYFNSMPEYIINNWTWE